MVWIFVGYVLRPCDGFRFVIHPCPWSDTVWSCDAGMIHTNYMCEMFFINCFFCLCGARWLFIPFASLCRTCFLYTPLCVFGLLIAAAAPVFPRAHWCRSLDPLQFEPHTASFLQRGKKKKKKNLCCPLPKWFAIWEQFFILQKRSFVEKVDRASFLSTLSRGKKI